MMNRQARRLELVVDGDDTTDSRVPWSPQEQSQIRRRYPLPIGGRDVHKRPTFQTPRPRMGLGAIPRRLIDNREMMALPLDQRTAFVLSQIDGKTPLRTLVDVTGFVADEIVALIERLIELKAIALS